MPAVAWIAPFSLVLAAFGSLLYWLSQRRRRARQVEIIAHERLARERDWAYRRGRGQQARFSFVGKIAGRIWEVAYWDLPEGGRSARAIFTMAELAIPEPRLVIVGQGALAGRGPSISMHLGRGGEAMQVGSAAFQSRFAVISNDPTLTTALIDPQIEHLFVNWPLDGKDRFVSEDALEVRWDERGLYVSVAGMSVGINAVKHLVELGFALAERLALSDTAGENSTKPQATERKPAGPARSPSIARRSILTA